MATDGGSEAQPRVAVVTGGSRGIGRSVVEQLAGDGLNVVVVYASNKSEARAAVAAVESRGAAAIAFGADVNRGCSRTSRHWPRATARTAWGCGPGGPAGRGGPPGDGDMAENVALAHTPSARGPACLFMGGSPYVRACQLMSR